jgi:putative addiction module killer protein
MKFQVVEYIDERGRSVFAKWFDALDARAAAKITMALTRMAMGNLGDVKSVGGGVQEKRIDWGPGYRIYFGRKGASLILLLTGGSKKRQDRDITKARALWSGYVKRGKRNH